MFLVFESITKNALVLVVRGVNTAENELTKYPNRKIKIVYR